MTVGDIRLWLEDKTVSRNISDEAVYGSDSTLARRTGLDHHIQTVLNHFIRKTNCTRLVEDFAMESGQWEFDLSLELPSFRADLLLDVWIDGERPLQLVDDGFVRQKRFDSPNSEDAPVFIGFTSLTEFICWPATDDEYTLKLRRREPLISWSPGDTNADALEINLPDDVLAEVIPTGIVASLQGLDLEMANPINTLLLRYNELVSTYRGGLGVRITHLQRRSDYDSEVSAIG